MTRLLLAALALVAACAPAGAPAQPAHITGTVTQVSSGGARILVEERPQDVSGSGKAAVTITTSTRIWNAAGGGGARLSPSDLSVGARVRVWFDGPVADSYPVQGRAADIAVDR